MSGMGVRVTLGDRVLIAIEDGEVMVTTDEQGKAIAFRMLVRAMAELANIDAIPWSQDRSGERECLL